MFVRSRGRVSPELTEISDGESEVPVDMQLRCFESRYLNPNLRKDLAGGIFGNQLVQVPAEAQGLGEVLERHGADTKKGGSLGT